MMPKLFDTHAHLDQEEFNPDRAEMLARARAAGVEKILAVGITRASSERTVALAAEQAMVHAAVGIHPNSAAEAEAGDWDAVVKLATRDEVAAIGETGLDRHWDFTPWDVQQDYFDRHLRLSQQTDLPLVIHSRECDADILAMLREARRRGPINGILHSFCGAVETAAEALELGLHISFAGMVTYKKNDDLRAIAAAIRSDRILIETDSPYLSPVPVRKIRRNEPAHVLHTAACLATVRGLSLEDFAEQTTANARRLLMT